MNTSTSIPEDALLLLDCLRRAFSGRPFSSEHTNAPAEWPALLTQARQQGVETYLYPWLASSLPVPFAAPDPGSPFAGWRARFLEAVTQTLRRQRQLASILAAFSKSRIDVIALKGAWLSENVYDDPAQRTMSDLDLLIRDRDRAASHEQLLALGYSAERDIRNNAYIAEQTYTHPNHPKPLELHWHVASEMFKGTPRPDLEAVWRHTRAARLLGFPVCELSPSDQLAHLVQHMLSHLLAMPLRGYLDVALLVRKHGGSLSPESLAAAGARWKTGQAIPFVLGAVRDLLGLEIPAPLQACVPAPDAALSAQLQRLIFTLPEVRQRDGETTLIRFAEASPQARVLLLLERIFMPREFLKIHYPCARHPAGLPLAWLLRARDLVRANRTRLHAVLTPGTGEARRLAHAKERTALVQRALRG